MKSATESPTCSLDNRPVGRREDPGEIATDFASAVAERDYDRLRRLIADDVTVRALLPRGLVEWQGAGATVEHFQFWYDRLLAAWGRVVAPVLVEDRYVAGWHHEGNFEDGSGRHVIEQRAVLQVGERGIAHIDLVCTGFRRADRLDADGASEGRS